MQAGFFSLWIARGLRLSIVVGILTAAWHSWGVFSRYQEEELRWFKIREIYECAARLKDDDLKAMSQSAFHTINMKGVCSFDGEDHWVSLGEIAEVRNGTMKFETFQKPFDRQGTFIVGIIGALTTMLATVAVLAAILLVRWVWGKPSN